ncbi:hypothetical protein ANRL1_01003 [Anaerolineae bacterium]|nr:hypothetical protein ANRL1_01003 [Anaerolineae bacterium]
MNLYQIVLEIYDGVNRYQEKQFVLAVDDRSAARFAREFADTWRPNARHDHEHDIYSDPDGWSQWTLAQCAVVTQFTVRIVGKKHSAQVALVPWQNAFGDMLTVAAKLLSALCDPALADCSLKWVSQDHLNLSERAVTQARKAVIELEDRVVGCTSTSARETETTR